MSIWQWNRFGLTNSCLITLGEGNSPLLRSRSIGPQLGIKDLFFKLETTNPTGSYKDRFAASAVAHMLSHSQTRCVATSSGNTGSALAAYCAAASVKCYIAVVESAPQPKLRQMMAYGAHIFRIQGFGLDPVVSERAFDELRKFSDHEDAALQVSSYTHSPLGMQGVTSLSHELAEQLPGADHLFAPAGGGGLCVALAEGYQQVSEQRRVPIPAIHCVQPEGNDTIATPLRLGWEQARDVECKTQISGLQVPNVIDGNLVIQSCRPTGGTGHAVTDESIWQAQRMLAREEGVFCEPAAATSLAGAIAALENGSIRQDASVVCLITGTGFKDEASIDRLNRDQDCPLIPLEDLATVLDD